MNNAVEQVLMVRVNKDAVRGVGQDFLTPAYSLLYLYNCHKEICCVVCQGIRIPRLLLGLYRFCKGK